MKRKIIGIAFVMLMLASTTAAIGRPTDQTTPATPQPAAATDWWTMLRHDAGNTGSTTSLAPNTDQLKWQTAIPESILYTAPIVANNHVYINTNSYLFLNPPPNRTTTFPPPAVNPRQLFSNPSSNYEGSIFCLDTKTGVTQWQQTFTAPNTPAYLNDKLYFTDLDIYGYQGNLHCLNATTGAQLFTRPISGLGTSPTIAANNKLYFASLDFYSYSASVNCANTAGDIQWTYQLPAYQWLFSAPSVDSGNVCFITTDLYSYYTGSLICLNAETGAYKWSQTVGNIFLYFYSPTVPACVNGKVYITDLNIPSYSTYIRCFDGNTGSTVWTHPLPNGISLTSPSISDGSLFVSVTNFDSYQTELLKLYASNGSLQWTVPVPAIESLLGYTICSADKVFVTSSSYGYQYTDYINAFDKTTGDFLWTHYLTQPMTGEPSIAAGILYLTDVYGGVYALADQLKVTDFKGGFLKANAILTNTGNNTFSNIAWRMIITGGYFSRISVYKNGTISTINAAQSITIPAGPVFGFGHIILDVTISPQGSVSFTKHAEGTAIGPFILLKGT